RTWYGMIATVAGVGTYSRMPGTLGSAAALMFFILTGYNSIPLILGIAVIGAVAADRYARAVSRDDPEEVVIDEVAGFFVSVWGLKRNFGIVGFFMFRIVDILKPFPVRQMEGLPGGVGIMADDICGGIMVNLILRAILWLFFEGGLEIAFKFFGIGT
ncbi:MAG: phosphatidylglycerophosphatase A, partial [Synergistaceae bacterium]|nr:phosphatidylglycerophosphatase A [Synergistaceae bacterium]